MAIIMGCKRAVNLADAFFSGQRNWREFCFASDPNGDGIPKRKDVKSTVSTCNFLKLEIPTKLWRGDGRAVLCEHHTSIRDEVTKRT